MKEKRKASIVLMTFLVAAILCCDACSSRKNSSGKNDELIDVMVDWKDITDPRGVYLPEGSATGESNPQIVNTLYETDDVVIADIIPTEMGYAVDNTGKYDSTDGIQDALYDCYNAGGGTVYLPAGNYAITDTIYVPPHVTLRGDWQDPDEGTEYGTIVSVWMDSSEAKDGGAFMVAGSAGILGMTVYYPFQTLYEVLPYPATFYVEDDAKMVTLKNITVINGYRGVSSSYEIAHDSLNLDHFKGTFLYCGVEEYNEAEVGTFDDVVISGKYWKEAAADCMNRPVARYLEEYLKKNATGMILGDCEWPTYANITIEGYSVGISFVAGYRYKFSGSMIDINIVDCGKGIVSTDGDERWGMVIARSSIDGGIAHGWISLIRMADVAVNGEITEMKPGSVERNDVDLKQYEIDYKASYVKPKEKLLVANLEKGITTDVSQELQAALDEMGATGGVVYVPGGTYRLDHPIRIPAGVELRGTATVAGKEWIKNVTGTLFMCYYGDESSYDADTDEALVTLAGDYAGVNGIRFLYPENGPNDVDLNSTYVIRGQGTGVYVVNSFIAAAGYGIDFRNCDEHYLRENYISCYYTVYRLGGKDGIIRGCLTNPNMIARTVQAGLVNWIGLDEQSEKLTEPVTCENTRVIVLNGAVNQLILGVFSYGQKNLIVNENSRNTLAVNIGSDWMNKKEAQLVNRNADMTVINSMRYEGHSYDNENGSLALYNRITINDINEKIEIIDREK